MTGRYPSNETIQLYGGIPKLNGSGAFEAELWVRVPKDDWLKQCSHRHARLAVSELPSFHLHRIPKRIVLFIDQWIRAGGQDSLGNHDIKYPAGDLRNIVFLHEAAKDLGIKTLINRTAADIEKANAMLRQSASPTGKIGVAPFPSAPRTHLPAPHRPDNFTSPPPPPPETYLPLPLTLIAKDKDGTWLVHVKTAESSPERGELRSWHGQVTEDMFQGVLNVIGVVTSKGNPAPLKENLVLVARRGGEYWKVVATPTGLARELDGTKVRPCGNLVALGRVLSG